MDLIGQLAGQLGIDATQAKTLAGTVLGAAQRQAPPEAAAQMEASIPELSDWSEQAEQGQGDSGFGGLLNAAAGAIGGQQAQDVAQIVQLLGKFGVDTSKASLVAPTILQFLRQRLDDNILQLVLQAAPLLAGAGGAAAASPAQDDDGFGLDDAANLLGGLFGRK